MASEQPEWARCGHDGCIGVRLPTTALCLSHAAEQAPDAFEAELKRIGAEGTVDARGVVISDELLRRLLAAAPREDDRPAFTAAVFHQASFQGGARFDGATFQGAAWFTGASFERGARFDGTSFGGVAGFAEASFQGVARFDGARFQGVAGFAEASFHDEAGFDGTSFQGEAGFVRASFHDEAGFVGASFQDRVWFDGTSFGGVAGFAEASFQGEAGFDGASFHDAAGFDGASFHDEAWFTGASFERAAWFTGASFEGVAWFGEASFEGEAWFGEASFEDRAWFTGASFEGVAGFDGASFRGEAEFHRASFRGGAGFAGASFASVAGFGGASFGGLAGFDGASFRDRVWFAGASFQGEAWFVGASFERATQIGPLLARQLVLDGAVFGARVQLEATAAAVCARRAQFPAGVHMRLRFASVVLDDANLVAPAILAGVPSPFPKLANQEEQIARVWRRVPPGPRAQRWRPRLLSVCRADVAGLRLADVDLRACRFVGAHNLDRLRIEGAPLFARTAGWWRARRKTLAEEHHWRARRPGRWRPAGWYHQACQPPASPEAGAPDVLDPARLAALYRDLRKGREDAKDEPGAADFYYGECEMRRHDPGTPRAERLVLWAYWLLSGYALRAWRALATLAVVVLLAGIVLAFWGFPSAAPSFRPTAVDRGGALVYQQQPTEPPSGLERLPDAIRFSARSATALLRGPDRALTPLGEWLEIGLRFAGPVLLGLAVLSVRGRVRR